jgi:hypothetical protein
MIMLFQVPTVLETMRGHARRISLASWTLSARRLAAVEENLRRFDSRWAIISHG